MGQFSSDGVSMAMEVIDPFEWEFSTGICGSTLGLDSLCDSVELRRCGPNGLVECGQISMVWQWLELVVYYGHKEYVVHCGFILNRYQKLIECWHCWLSHVKSGQFGKDP